MPAPLVPTFLSRGRAWLTAVLLALAGACALVQPQDSPVVRVVGLTPLPSEGMELRFGLRLRVQNPNDGPIGYDGIAVSLDLDGRGLASGVSNASGTIDRFGEAVIEVPVTVSLFSALREAWTRLGDLERGRAPAQIPYSLTGKLGGGDFGAVRFSSEGVLSLDPPKADR